MVPNLPKGFSHPTIIGTGAFSSVYRVRQDTLGRWVALKITDEKNCSRRTEMLKQARTQSLIRSDSIPAVYDVFEWRTSVCIVMQWINGIRLTDIISSNSLPEEKNLLSCKVLKAVFELHNSGFAHRDLKPDNILISKDGKVYLVDFGFTKEVGKEFTSTLLQGTPAYLAPEMLQAGSDIDMFKVDLFAIGKVLTELMGDEPEQSFIQPLLNTDPSKRPSIGSEFYRTVEKKLNIDYSFESHLINKVSVLCDEKLMAALITAANELTYTRRYDEAYWLTVECLEIDGNNKLALNLIETLSSRKRSSSVSKYVSSTVIIVSILVCSFAFYLGRSTGNSPVIYFNENTHIDNNSLHIDIKKLSPNIKEFLPLHDLKQRGNSLSGTVIIDGLPERSAIKIDGEIVQKLPLSGIDISYGQHTITCQDSANNKVYTRTVSVLPFQTKRCEFVKGKLNYGK